MLKKIMTLKFDEKPPYDFIIDSLNAELAKTAKDGPPAAEHRFEWCTHDFDAEAASKDEAISPNMCDFRSEFIKNNEIGESEASGASSGQVMSSYLKNSCGNISGMTGSCASGGNKGS